ncbi:MAG: peptide ABC transporter substrate-binding protein [Solirubrobacteraceae bacterium]
MRSHRAGVGIVAALAATLIAYGSAAADTNADPVNDDQATISYNQTEPANPLIPGNTTEVGGISVVGSLFKGLVEYDAKTAAPTNAVAESIRTSDSKVYRIRLKPGWTFHDGTPVTAKSFVDAWNYTAYAPNKMLGATYLSPIKGFKRANSVAPGAKRPAARTMSGLKVVDDRTFVVTLSAPFSEFATRLGYAAFFPLPASFFADRKAFEAHPVGNGPFRFVSYTPGKDLVVKRYDAFGGERKPHIGGIDFRFYKNLDDAYADVVADKLDYLSFTPWSSTVNDKFKTDLPETRRARYEYLGYQAIAFPVFDERYADVRLRRAISMAIDRVDLIKQVFNGARAPADGLVAPNVQGHRDNQCGKLCTYRPKTARRLFEASGFRGPIKLTSNIDSANQKWMEVTCASIQKTLGRTCKFVPQPTLGQFRKQLDDRTINAIYRSAWVADYPSIENFLNPLFRTGGASNVGKYSNHAVDVLLTRADAARSEREGHWLYQKAERLVLRDMPTVPIWWQSATAAWSSRLHNVTPTQFRELDLYTVTVSKAG